MIERIIIVCLTQLTSWLFARGVAVLHGREQKAQTDESIDKRLEGFKQAYKEAINGHPVTPEQRKNLKVAISDFIRGDNDGGL